MTPSRAVFAFLLGAACATAKPPPELVDARSDYGRAENGAASKFKPDELHEARQALDQAEKSFKDHGDSEETKTLAYVAGRKAQLAEVDGTAQQLIQEKNQASAQAAQQAAAGLAKYKKEAQETQQKLSAANLPMRQERRGTIVTLPGSVAFAPGSSTLRPSAQESLARVADAIKDHPDERLTIEGYTDSRGSAQFNEMLSQQRADAVREYLVSRGVPPDAIRAVGLGKSNPIATNATAEGRATNRRVEIVVNAEANRARRSAREPPVR